MESVLFLVEKFAYWHKAKQLAVLTNRLNNLQITVQVLKEGEKYRKRSFSMPVVGAVVRVHMLLWELP